MHVEFPPPSDDHLVAPLRFIEAVSLFCSRVGLDVDKVLAGHRFECEGVGFAFTHYGERDPQAATLFMDMGEVQPEDQAAIYRTLLQRNALQSASRDGCFGILPATDRLIYIVRIPLDEQPAGADALAASIGLLAHGVKTLEKVIADAGAEALRGMGAAAANADQPVTGGAAA